MPCYSQMTALTVPALQWKVLVVDETSRKLVNNATSEEDILNLNVTSMPAHTGARNLG